jgi:hypothetical protein
MTVRERPDAEEALAARIREATERLSTEFQGHFTPQAVEQCTLESLEQYRAAPVLEFVPLLVERFARQGSLRAFRGRRDKLKAGTPPA